MSDRIYKKYGVPKYRYFNGLRYTLSAATAYGVYKADAEYNKKYLKSLGYSVRTVKGKKGYYVYARKTKK